MSGQVSAQRSFKGSWSNIDQMDDPLAFVRFMDEIRPPEVDTLEAYRQPVELLRMTEGASLLDVGCGTGGAARAMAALVGRSGRVVGVDYSATMIAEATQRAVGLDFPLTFQVADAHALPFPDASFSGCHAGGVFEILQDPEQALQEMIRVAHPGGRVVILAPDAPVIDASDRALTRRIVDFICDHELNGWLGRQMPRLYKERGMTEVTVIPQTYVSTDYTLFYEKWLGTFMTHAQEAGIVTAAEADAWCGELAQRDREGTFFAALSLFWVGGTRP